MVRLLNINDTVDRVFDTLYMLDFDYPIYEDDSDRVIDTIHVHGNTYTEDGEVYYVAIVTASTDLGPIQVFFDGEYPDLWDSAYVLDARDNRIPVFTTTQQVIAATYVSAELLADTPGELVDPETVIVGMPDKHYLGFGTTAITLLTNEGVPSINMAFLCSDRETWSFVSEVDDNVIHVG